MRNIQRMFRATATPLGRNVIAAVEFNVLGPVTVAEGAESLNIGGPKQRTVLAMLIAHKGQPVSNDALADAVYGEEAPERGRRRVQTYVSTLRSVVGDVIARENAGWRLVVDDSQVDALQFESTWELVRNNSQMPPEMAAQHLREALAIWRGHPYSNVEAHGMLDPETTRLNELRLAVQTARIDADMASGRHADLIGEIESLMAEHPYYERFRAQHMLALYRAGRQREALRSFAQMRDLLIEEVGVDPGLELRDLEQRILEQDDSLSTPPRRQIQTKALLVAHPGDPIELARFSTSEVDTDLAQSMRIVDTTLSQRASRDVVHAGAATYAIFDQVAEAALAASEILGRLETPRISLAVDFGDIEVGDEGVAGAPVTRASILVASAHPGQVLVSADAQRALVSDGRTAGLRFESLGTHRLPGIEKAVAVYQLLVGDPPVVFPPLDTNRLPAARPEGRNRVLPGYELREAIGHGSVGALYRAYQPSLGREVIIEVIERKASAAANFIRNFELDAQRLALFDHPNINPLLDYWRDPGGAYLVYRNHRGGFLKSGVSAPPGLLGQLASALDYAHSHGVIHGSFRPDRVLLDEAGNGYLMGFPIAGLRPPSAPEHAVYVAPEVFEGGEPSVASDVFALGVLALEMSDQVVTEDEPLTSDSPPILRSLREEPAERPGSVAEFLAELETDDLPRDRRTEARNPYKGLSPYLEVDVADFFGRTGVVSELVSQLNTLGFVAVVGPSGVGKSSVVRAGLVPALRRGAIEGSSEWIVTHMTPGTQPFLELAKALKKVAVDLPLQVEEGILEGEPAALSGVDRLLPGPRLVVVVDQFEEIFTLCDHDTAFAFMDFVSEAVRRDCALFVMTLRADFLDRPLQHSEFGALLREAMALLSSPSEDELREVVNGPAHSVGVEFEATVVERMISEVHDRPGGLPLVQYALSQLFASRSADLIKVNDYEQIGGVTGALAADAENLFESLDPEQRTAAQQVFLRLVTLRDDGLPMRRRVLRSEFTDLDVEDPIDLFAHHRLLVFDSQPGTRAPTVEVAHEALFSHWPRLASWIEDARVDLAQWGRLDQAIQEWWANDRGDGYLLTGGRLSQHQAWTASTGLILPDRAVDFLRLSSQHDLHLRARTRRRRSLLVAGLIIVAVVTTALAVFSTRSAAIARARELAASAINVLADDPELAMLLSIQAMDEAPSGTAVFPEGLISLREAVDSNLLLDRLEIVSQGVTFLPDGEAILVSDTERFSVGRYEVNDNRIERDPTWVLPFAEGSQPHGIFVHPGGMWAVVEVTVPETADQTVTELVTIDVESGSRSGQVFFASCEQPIDPVFSNPFFSSDGSVLGVGVAATGCHTEAQAQWFAWTLLDTSTWAELARFDRAMVTMTGDGSQILVDHSDGPAELLSFPSLTHVDSFDVASGPALSVATPLRRITPDGQTVVVKYGGAEIRPGFWDVASNQLRTDGDSFDGLHEVDIQYTPEGHVVVVTTASDVIYDPNTGAKLLELPNGRNTAIAVSPDGTLAVSASASSGLELWLIRDPLVGTSLTDSAASIAWLNPDMIQEGPLTALWGYDPNPRGFPFHNHIAVLDTETGEVAAERRALDTNWDQLPDGRIALVQVDWGDDPEGFEDVLGPLTIWDPVGDEETILQDCTASLELLIEFKPEPDLIGLECPNGLPFFTATVGSADGRLLAALGPDPGSKAPELSWVMQIWDAETLEVVGQQTIAAGEVYGEWFPYFRDGWLLVWDGAVLPAEFRIVEVETGETVAQLDPPEAGWRGTQAVSETSTLIYLPDEGGGVHEYDTQSWSLIRSWQAIDARPRGIGLSPDGARLAISGDGADIVIWALDTDTPEIVDRIPIDGWASDMIFIDENRLGVGVLHPDRREAEWRILELSPEVVVDGARNELVRGFRPEECQIYEIDPCRDLEALKSGT